MYQQCFILVSTFDMSEHPAKCHHVGLLLNDKLKVIQKFERVPKPTLKIWTDYFLL